MSAYKMGEKPNGYERAARWLKAHPYATQLDARDAGKYHPLRVVHGTFGQAKIDLLGVRSAVSRAYGEGRNGIGPDELKELKLRLDRWEKRHQRATLRDIPVEYRPAFVRFYHCRITELRRKNGITTDRMKLRQYAERRATLRI